MSKLQIHHQLHNSGENKKNEDTSPVKSSPSVQSKFSSFIWSQPGFSLMPKKMSRKKAVQKLNYEGSGSSTEGVASPVNSQMELYCSQMAMKKQVLKHGLNILHHPFINTKDLESLFWEQLEKVGHMCSG